MKTPQEYNGEWPSHLGGTPPIPTPKPEPASEVYRAFNDWLPFSKITDSTPADHIQLRAVFVAGWLAAREREGQSK